MSQVDLAARSKIGVPTVRRMEGSDGAASGLTNNVDAVSAALEAAGVEFTNGGQPGVRLKLPEDTHAGSQGTNQPYARSGRFRQTYGAGSPERGMQQLERAKAKNELVKLKNRRAKLKGVMKGEMSMTSP